MQWDYVKRHKNSFMLFFLFLVVFSIVFYLENLPMDAVVYGTAICFFFGIIAVIADYYQYKKRHLALQNMIGCEHFEESYLPEPDDLIEQDYQELVKNIYQEQVNLLSVADGERTDMLDYYTMWVHQIKTPIAAMRLLIQSAQGNETTAVMENELFKIEQYVEMVLSYIRLGSDTTDYQFAEVNLDGLVRQAVRKYAKLFIHSKISLDMRELNMRVLTDEKWLVFVIEQILSNAIKYTKAGTISIYLNQNNELVIEDNGIGIDAADIPRVFEKGYTGYNGRYDKKSTGLGLYLCKRIVDKLGHSIRITSQPGVGTKVMISLKTVSVSELTYQD